MRSNLLVFRQDTSHFVQSPNMLHLHRTCKLLMVPFIISFLCGSQVGLPCFMLLLALKLNAFL